MKEYLVDAFILKSTRARDADRIITLYTKQWGKKKVMAHGVDKATSKKRGAVQPFGYSKLLLRRGKDLDSISQGESVEIFQGVRQSLEGLAVANYLAELVDAFAPEEDPNVAIFQLLLDAFTILNETSYNHFVWAFQLKLLSLSGYRPDLQECIVCGLPVQGEKVFFLPEQGGVLCPGCKPSDRFGLSISRGALENLKIFLRWDIRRLHQMKVSAYAEKEIQQVIRYFTEYHLEKRIKSSKFIELLEEMNHI